MKHYRLIIITVIISLTMLLGYCVWSEHDIRVRRIEAYGMDYYKCDFADTTHYCEGHK